MGKIIAIVNQKGGVGKTTTSVNVSAALAEAGKKTLLLDTDPQGNATSGVGIDAGSLENTIYEVLVGACSMEDSVVRSDYKDLYICPSGISLAGAEIELVSLEGREYRLKDAIESIAGQYDYILIDCPPSLGLITLNALTAAHSVLIPIQCEYYALEGLSQLTNTLRAVKGTFNSSLSIEGVLLTMFDGRTNLSIQVVEEVKNFYKDQVYHTVIPRNVRLSEAPSFGKPIMEYDASSKGASAYRELAQEIIKREKK